VPRWLATDPRSPGRGFVTIQRMPGAAAPACNRPALVAT